MRFFCKSFCGEEGIRTPGSRKGTTVFETAPFDHSGTSPKRKQKSVISSAIIIYPGLAEKEGFEPPVPAREQRFSRPPHSTTLPFLRCKNMNFFIPLQFIAEFLIQKKILQRMKRHHI